MTELINDPWLHRISQLLDEEPFRTDPAEDSAQSVRGKWVLERVLASVDHNNGPEQVRRATVGSRKHLSAKVSLALMAAGIVALAAVELTGATAQRPKSKTIAGSHLSAVAPGTKAKLLAALNSSGGDIIFQTELDSGPRICVGKTWSYPANVTPGEHFLMREACGSSYNEMFDVHVQGVYSPSDPAMLPTPRPHLSRKYAAEASMFSLTTGPYVCGIGSDIGYSIAPKGQAPPGEGATRWDGQWSLELLNMGSTPNLLRKAILSHELPIVGKVIHNGQLAIKLVAKPYGSSPAENASGKVVSWSGVSGVFYVNASSYLPIQSVTNYLVSTHRDLARSKIIGTSIYNFTYLQPTAANLRQLRVPIPKGLTLTSAPGGNSLPFSSCPKG